MSTSIYFNQHKWLICLWETEKSKIGTFQRFIYLCSYFTEHFREPIEFNNLFIKMAQQQRGFLEFNITLSSGSRETE